MQLRFYYGDAHCPVAAAGRVAGDTGCIEVDVGIRDTGCFEVDVGIRDTGCFEVDVGIRDTGCFEADVGIRDTGCAAVRVVGFVVAGGDAAALLLLRS